MTAAWPLSPRAQSGGARGWRGGCLSRVPRGRVDLGPAQAALAGCTRACGVGAPGAACRARARHAAGVRAAGRPPHFPGVTPGVTPSVTPGVTPARGVSFSFSPARARGSRPVRAASASAGQSSPPGFSALELVRRLEHWAGGRPAAGALLLSPCPRWLRPCGRRAQASAGRPAPTPGGPHRLLPDLYPLPELVKDDF